MAVFNPEVLIPLATGVVGLVLASRKNWANSPTRRLTQKTLRIVSPIMIVASLLLFIAQQRTKDPTPVDTEKLAADVRGKLKLPVIIDEDTQLDDIRPGGKNELVYKLTLTRTSKAQFDVGPGPQPMIDNLLTVACKNPSYATLFRAGVTLTMLYQTNDRVEAVRIVLSPKDCGF